MNNTKVDYNWWLCLHLFRVASGFMMRIDSSVGKQNSVIGSGEVCPKSDLCKPIAGL